MKTTLLFRLVILVVSFFCNAIFAQWSSVSYLNTAVCTATNSQQRPTQVSDGNGGSIMAWSDLRNGNDDIYLDRISADGLSMWGTGFVCNAANSQGFPTIISDGSGGAIVVWIDLRNGIDYDIYAQKVNASGTPQWTLGGFPVCTFTANQNAPAIVSDGFGGAFISWTDQRTGSSSSDIYMQRILSNGVAQFAANGFVISQGLNKQQNPVMVNSNNGVIIAWEDNRNSATNWDIYAQVFNGSSLLGADVVICNAANLQQFPQLIADGNQGAILTWEDKRTDNAYNIYAQRLLSDGTINWAVNGIIVCNEVGYQVKPKIATDGNHGAIICWEDGRNTSNTGSDIFAQRINSNGVLIWDPAGLAISEITGNQSQPEITTDNAGGAIIAFLDNFSSPPFVDIYAQRIGSGGTNLWALGGEPICTTLEDQFQHKIIVTNTGSAIVCWTDNRNVASDIFAQKINPNGSLTLANNSFENIVFSIYPNPTANGNFSIKSQTAIQEVTAFDILGKQIDVEKNNDSYKINASTGIYTIKIIDDNGNSQIKKLILN